MPVLSSAAWIAHDLGLATSIGGSLFGQAALEPSLATLSDPSDRQHVQDVAWRRFSWWNLAAHAVVAVSWFTGRAMLSGREAEARGLTRAKDVLVVTSLVSGIATTLLGRKLSQEEAGVDGRAKGLQRAVSAASTLNLASNVGVAAVTAVLAMRGGESRRFARVSRDLP